MGTYFPKSSLDSITSQRLLCESNSITLYYLYQKIQMNHKQEDIKKKQVWRNCNADVMTKLNIILLILNSAGGI